VIVVEPLGPSDDEAYDAFVCASPDTLFYHSSAYRRLLRDLLGAADVTLVAHEEGELRGVLPLLAVDGPLGKVVNSLPYYGSNGGVVAASDAVAASLASAYGELTSSSEAAAATIIPNPFAAGPHPAVAHDLLDDRYAHFTPLQPARDALVAQIDSSARRNVAKAIRAGVTVGIEHDQLARLHELHDANIRAIGGRPKSARFFEEVGRRFEPVRDYDVWVARVGGEVVAALLVFHWNGVVEYFTPAIAHEARSDQPLSAILLEAMATYGEQGMRLWNWGATWKSQESLRRFKRKWGARETVYSYRVRLNAPELLDWSAAEILAAYPDFYVVPFASLRTAGGEPSAVAS
jgi:Acetyltransferase (GNAT) domain